MNCHERHDFLFAAPGEAREETADGLDAVLGIAGDADDRFADLRNFGVPPEDDKACSIVSLMKPSRYKSCD
ncbi:MAG: hypothetical protein WDM76_16170 [Limisphaerales bacterium]